MIDASIVAILVACITGIPGIVAAVLANRGRQHARAARIQVENDHTTNLRDDQDEKHAETAGQNNLLINLLMGAKSDIRGMRRDTGRLADRIEAIGSRLDDHLKGGEK